MNTATPAVPAGRPLHALLTGSIKTRSLVLVLLIGLLGVVLSTGLRLRGELQQQSRQLGTEQRALPLLYAEPLRRSLSQPPAETALLLSHMLSRPGVLAVELRASSGQRLSAGDPAQPDGQASEFALPDAAGTVRVLHQTPGWRSLLASQQWLGTALEQLGLVLVLSLASVLVLERLMLRPLRRLAAEARSFDPTQPPGISRWSELNAGSPPPRELRELNAAFEQAQLSLGEELQREQARAQALSAEVERRNEALRAAELALRAQQRELAALSRHDALTGLANRREFDDALRREFKRAQRLQSQLALAVIDLDSFKRFNQTEGHAAGDAALQAFAALLGERFKRDTDMAARLGGEEFVVLLPGLDLAESQALLEQLREDWRAQAPQHAGSQSADQRLTVSIGLAALSPLRPYLSPQALMQAADEALYIAKHTGRDRLSLAA